MSVLDTIDLSAELGKKEYEARLADLQFKMLRLQRAVFQLGHRVVLAFEGWDASGKGGAIKRLTEAIDPRGFVVHAIAAPTPEERAHNYLWRFWTRLPRDGQIVIFDRSWYGRVLVERVEGFATLREWQQAYGEINDFERTLHNDRTTILKFFVHLSKEEQHKRFLERENDPLKTWKLTPEDWRNREKWDAYYAAIDEMLTRTSTEIAPWHVVAGVDKRWARINVLETVVNELVADMPFDFDDQNELVLDRRAARERVEAGQLSAAAVDAVIAEEEKVRDLLARQPAPGRDDRDEPKSGKKKKKK
ncbi:MAG TPA: polyphosphate kinase [Herpetosiphonaceae bacterium]|nr:polyphosphate kinase [Herpetosiphonaceae bacterium]